MSHPLISSVVYLSPTPAATVEVEGGVEGLEGMEHGMTVTSNSSDSVDDPYRSQPGQCGGPTVVLNQRAGADAPPAEHGFVCHPAERGFLTFPGAYAYVYACVFLVLFLFLSLFMFLFLACGIN